MSKARGIPDAPPGKFILVLDQLGADGTFAVMHQLQCAIRSRKRSVCFVGFRYPLTHYLAVAKKMGMDLAKASAANKFTFVDCLSSTPGWADCVSITDVSQGGCNPSNGLPVTRVGLEGKQPFKELYRVMHEASVKRGAQGTLFILDDLSPLFNATSANESSLLMFMHYCRTLCRDGDERNTVVALMHSDDVWADSTVTSLAHMADLCIRVDPLPSGYSRDVHGTVNVSSSSGLGQERGNPDTSAKRGEGGSENGTMQFLVTDSGGRTRGTHVRGF
eukprot:TRINITY_DN4898_c0_g1_i2.p2 TRINITY_DN4898_c0_g1~~TRINITY_DN4898_c0_g1_i2.p2  ORF type:complete len:276 (+),score=40.87 TRINITY_DN4898_c0_g1_i2:235-1062(+)